MIRSKLGVMAVAAISVLALSSPASASGHRHGHPLTGMGATPAEMKAAHGVSYIKGGVCSASPHCLGPAIHNKEGFNYLFTSVTFQGGVLTTPRPFRPIRRSRQLNRKLFDGCPLIRR